MPSTACTDVETPPSVNSAVESTKDGQDADCCDTPHILKPISMNTITRELKKKSKSDGEDFLECLLCTETFPCVRNDEKSPLLAHLLTQHKIVIADVDKIADFNRYIRYWKEKFSTMDEITQYCVVINSNAGAADKDPSEKYYLLTDFLPEDQTL